MAHLLELPSLMVAPNGARRGKKDHPKIPITIPEIVQTATACAAAGADGIHLHMRDAFGKHILDVGLYRELLTELNRTVPDLMCQITTEAVGVYSPIEQRALVRELRPESVSISITEMYSSSEVEKATRFYLWCLEENIAVQHILYGSDDLKLLNQLLVIPGLREHTPQLLFVLGRYADNRESRLQDLEPIMAWLNRQERVMDWAVCAFGVGETQCLVAAHEMGGKMRVGFENSIWNSDGKVATDNAERVTALTSLIK